MIIRRRGIINRTLSPCVAAIAATTTFLSLGGYTSLHAQEPQSEWHVADLAGEWTVEAEGCDFENVLLPGELPGCENWTGWLVFEISLQSGRAFAGTFRCPPPDFCGDYVTGVVTEDGTVRMQAYRDNNRNFFVGKLSIGPRNTVQFKGFLESREDLNRATAPSLGSAYFTATKRRYDPPRNPQ